MKRLTYEIIDTGIVVDKDDVEEFEIEDGVTVYKGNAVFRLADYEDTGLTPQEIMELKERDTAKKIVNYGVDVPECPHCGSLNIYYCEENMKYEYCPECGQRLKWED